MLDFKTFACNHAISLSVLETPKPLCYKNSLYYAYVYIAAFMSKAICLSFQADVSQKD